MRSSHSISAMLCSASIRLNIQHEHGNGQLGRHETARVSDLGGSRHAQTLERGVSRSSTDVRHNDQFKNRDIGDLNSILFDLAFCVR